MTKFNREDSRTVLPQLEKMIDKLEPKEIVVKMESGSTGIIKFKKAIRSGNVVHIYFTAVNDSAVNGGSNIATGKILNYRPYGTTYTGCSWYGNRSILSSVGTNGSIVVRNAASTQHPANTTCNIYITYITGE